IGGSQSGASSVSNSVLGDVSVVMVSPLDCIFIIKFTIDLIDEKVELSKGMRHGRNAGMIGERGDRLPKR
ncbi:MAG: hypothetical protein MGG11_23175, partial [Trichodesmium sp. MAG_R03]|nr:hypothetical protein [Trichodesmium sp. MAG_R03]